MSLFFITSSRHLPVKSKELDAAAAGIWAFPKEKSGTFCPPKFERLTAEYDGRIGSEPPIELDSVTTWTSAFAKGDSGSFDPRFERLRSYSSLSNRGFE